MEFFIQDHNLSRQAPEDVRIEDLRVEPYPDGRRVRVALTLTPFQQRPTIELTLANEAGAEVGSASIIEPVAWKLEMTLHIHQADNPVSGEMTLKACVMYPEMEMEVDQRTLSFQMTGN